MIGWENDETIAFEIGYDIRKSDGAKYNDLTDQEQSELDHNARLWAEVKETKRWTRSR